MRYHGITKDTYKRFQIDAGEIRTGFTDFDSPGALLGATRGGSTFTLEQEIREMEVDGARGPVKGSRRITMVKASLTVNFIEHTADLFKKAIVGATSQPFSTDWDKITRSLSLSDQNYISDITIVGNVTGPVDGMGIQLSNVIADGNIEINKVDKDESVITVTFTAHFDPSDMEAKDDTEPWSILWPLPPLLFLYTKTDDKIRVSPDGVTWDEGTVPESNISFAAADSRTYVIMSGAGNLYFSTDSAQNWSSVLGNPVSPNFVTFVGDRFFSPSNTSFYTSITGGSWTEQAAPVTKGWSAAVHGNGTTIVVGEDTAAVSTDLQNWSTYTIPTTPTGGSYQRGAYGNGNYVFINASELIYSADGQTWNSVTMPEEYTWIQIAYGSGVFVAVGFGSATAYIYYSTDLQNWYPAPSGTMSGIFNANIVYGNGMFVAPGGNNIEGYVAYSTDGQNWNKTVVGAGIPTSGIAYG